MAEKIYKYVRPKPAATVLVVRDGLRGLEVLMVERSRNIAFGGGALVFPGGKLDTGDLHKMRSAFFKNEAMTPHLLKALAVTGAREVFEESGLLLTRKNGRLVSDRERQKLAAIWRDRLGKDRCELSQFLNVTGHRLDLEDFLYFARWITPVGRIKRYDTRFFITRAPKNQTPSHDGWELVNARWMRPSDILENEGEAPGQFRLMFPTRMNLRRLARSKTVGQAFADARAQRVMPIEPGILRREGKIMATIPHNAGYGSQTLFERGPV